MLDSQGFDLWADGYDQSVREADQNDEYPFAGYAVLMNAVYGTVMRSAPAKVLDVGIGTAVLSKKLYDAGCAVTGLDFSKEMLTAARRKMPDARLILCDFSQGIPPELAGESFDFILSIYALHHLAYGTQAEFISALLKRLKPQGRMLIGDVCFATRDALDACRDLSGELWDDEEHYIVFSELRERLEGVIASFHPFSHCAGVIEIQKETA